MSFLGPIFLAVLTGAAFGQSSGRPAFEIAAVHASASVTNPDTFVSGGLLRDGRYELRKATILDLIGIAWGVNPDKVVGGPSWLGFDRFDISAKAPPTTSADAVNRMIQSLLADRFHLVLHNDSRPIPEFALILGKGELRLKEAHGSGPSGCQSQPQSGTPAYSIYSCRNISIGAFAEALHRIAGDYLREPVMDSTGLAGSWDFDIKWHPRSRVVAGADRTSIFDAVEKQLGLKLELKQVPAEVLVVDRVNQRPTADAPGVAEMLPQRSPEFEVAAIKPSSPAERFGFRRYPGGRIELRAVPMKMLIATAWDVDWDHMDERIAGPQKWADSKRFDIVANTSALPDETRGKGFIDEDFQLMLRALLTDRFKLAAHFEDRPVSTYTLTASRPKLKKADPGNRSNCKEARLVPHDPRDLNPRLSRLIQCQNTTMPQFARQLRTLDRVEATFNDVVDETGLQGAYDFTLNFTPRSLLNGTPAADTSQVGADGIPAASDPNGALSFLEAVRQQLGLKLEMRKRPRPVLVIDHIEDNPTAN